MSGTIFDLSARTNDGKDLALKSYEGKVLLIVNTASKCGFTPQYEGLESLYKKYKDKGFVILGFPCDQFAHQEPAGDAEIAQFCQRNFGVSFPIMSKIEVNGPGAHPVFEFVKSRAPKLLGSRVKWNFTKFLVEADGKTVKRFSPATEPAKLEKHIEASLKAAGGRS